jgi:hypothetical protein
MVSEETGGNPVLHYLAVARAARDFGLPPDELDQLAADVVVRDRRSVEAFADSVASVLLERVS